MGLFDHDKAFDECWSKNRLPVQKGTLRRGWRLGAEAERARLLRLAEEMAAEYDKEANGAVIADWAGRQRAKQAAMTEFVRRAKEDHAEKPGLPTRIRIMKSSPGAWYTGREGEVFHAYQQLPDAFLVERPEGGIWTVIEADCEPVFEEGEDSHD